MSCLAYQANLMEPRFVVCRDEVEPKYSRQDRTSHKNVILDLEAGAFFYMDYIQ